MLFLNNIKHFYNLLILLIKHLNYYKQNNFKDQVVLPFQKRVRLINIFSFMNIITPYYFNKSDFKGQVLLPFQKKFMLFPTLTDNSIGCPYCFDRNDSMG